MTKDDAHKVLDAFEREASRFGCFGVWDAMRCSIAHTMIGLSDDPTRIIDSWVGSYGKETKLKHVDT